MEGKEIIELIKDFSKDEEEEKEKIMLFIVNKNRKRIWFTWTRFK